MPVLGSGKDTPAIPGGDAGGASPPESTLPCVSRHNLSSATKPSVTHPVLSRAEQLKLDKVKMKAAISYFPVLDTSASKNFVCGGHHRTYNHRNKTITT